MKVCLQCGEENPERARFCLGCATALTELEAPREQRKVVTVLFCDLSGSTALGEELDPEPLRGLLARYFEQMKAIVERHGGTVEKFIGDAVMAVFGVPVVHEDDALRAVRAAVEMRDAFPGLGIEGRIGLATGEVVTGTEERLATGDAVNVAARLEQAAQPGDVLIAEGTFRLVRAGVEVEPLEPLELKGKAEPVNAHRLLTIRAGATAIMRHLEAPMIGRTDDLDLLARAFERSGRERSCHLFTILGPAGVGKSRLAAEFLASVEDARVASGRCLSYGEGITYWPVVEVLKQLPAAIDGAAAATISALTADEQLATSSQEIAWAFRKQLEAVASEQALVCVFDDVHWGEETFLDLLEHVADLSRDAPILLLCMARPELLDRRPGWAGGKINATTVLLEPLEAAETERLIESLADLDAGLRDRILQVAEGNPLFVEETIALVQESGTAEVTVPPTIQALLAARLDQLEAAERDVVERGAVEGRVFHRGAVQALAPEEHQLTTRLASLVRKELVRPDKPQVPGEDAYRFRHLLIRDAAYDSLPKATRAELHERFADWLERHGASLVELDEILGHHLEHACRYRAELGQGGGDGERAARHLGRAGVKAYARGDPRAASNLLTRAVALLPTDSPDRLELLPELGQARFEAGDLAGAAAILEEAIDAAEGAGLPGLAARARVSRLSVQIQTDPALDIARFQSAAAAAIVELEQANDERGLARAWLLMTSVHNFLGRATAMGAAAERAADHARRCGADRQEADSLFWQVAAAIQGPLPVGEGRSLCEHIVAESRGRLQVEAAGRTGLSLMNAFEGRFEDAREHIAAARSIYRDLGLQMDQVGTGLAASWIESLAQDWQACEQVLRESYDALEAIGETGYRSTIAYELADALYRLDRLEEAERFTRASARAAAPGDMASQTGWRSIEAVLLAHGNQPDEAEALAHEALDLVRQTDFTEQQGYVLSRLAEVLCLNGKQSQARSALDEALALYKRKGNIVRQDLVRARLEELDAA